MHLFLRMQFDAFSKEFFKYLLYWYLTETLNDLYLQVVSNIEMLTDSLTHRQQLLQ